MKFKCKCGEILDCDFKVAYDWVQLDAEDISDMCHPKSYLGSDSYYAKCSNCKRISEIYLDAKYTARCIIDESHMEETK